MSAPITNAHLRLANQIVASPPSPLVMATLIADSEAAAVQIAMLREYGNLCATNESLAKECDRLRHEVELDEQLQAVTENSLKIVTAERDQLRAEVEELKESILVQQIFSDDRQRAERAEAELAAERARLDWLSARGFEHRHHETGDHLGYEWTISSYSEFENVTLRDVIDAEMKEDAK